MANVLADMAIEVKAATLLALRVVRASDHIEGSAQEKAFARVATPMAKLFNCSRAPAVAYEALQCHGGNGFIEENPMARIYREAPLNSVWEGSANMNEARTGAPRPPSPPASPGIMAANPKE